MPQCDTILGIIREKAMPYELSLVDFPRPVVAGQEMLFPRQETGINQRRGCLAAWQLSRVARFIEANLADTIRIKDLAASIHLSASYFYQAFRRSTGISPYAFIIHCRIQHVQELMLRTNRPLCQIALDCGLADQSYLTRQFGRITGMSPASWRRARRAVGSSLSPGRRRADQR
jgi:AraC-like DNA-binding protein